MTSRVLVAYGSKHGSTEEVATAIAFALDGRGLTVDLEPAAVVTDLAPYGLVVLGGSLYFGRWHQDARRLLRSLGRAPGTREVAVFAMGPRTLDAADIASSRAQLHRALQRVPAVVPQWEAIFGGVIRPERLAFPFNRMPASDARDWAAIRAWATRIADECGAAREEDVRV